MGISEWGLPANSTEELQAAVNLVDLHNTAPVGKRGETLTYGPILKRNETGATYICVRSGGGRDYTSAFIRANYAHPKAVIYSLNHPKWWNDPTKYTTVQTNSSREGRGLTSPYDGSILRPEIV
jgi:hypothetical protein